MTDSTYFIFTMQCFYKIKNTWCVPVDATILNDGMHQYLLGCTNAPSLICICLNLLHVTSVFLKKKTCSVFFFKKHVFFSKKTLLKKKGSKCFFFSKPPVFKINSHNLSQFVNHTVILVQNKNNNEIISLK